jgi:hypothetical protein
MLKTGSRRFDLRGQLIYVDDIVCRLLLIFTPSFVGCRILICGGRILICPGLVDIDWSGRALFFGFILIESQRPCWRFAFLFDVNVNGLSRLLLIELAIGTRRVRAGAARPQRCFLADPLPPAGAPRSLCSRAAPCFPAIPSWSAVCLRSLYPIG